MPILALRNLTVTHGGPPVLRDLDLRIDAGERVCLLGRNGCGKTTLLRVIAGREEPDRGEVEVAASTRIGYLPQEVPLDLDGTVFDVIAAGLGDAGGRLAAYHAVSHDLAEQPENAALLIRLERLQRELETSGGWEQHRRVEKVVARFGLDPDAAAATLSAGRKRRTLLARALVAEPDLLLLDEPTNHLDIEAIADVEEYLRGFGGALLFVSHDRVLLQRIASRILDLDRGRLRSFACDYTTYRERKQALLDEELKHEAAFEKKLAEEETWIRQGVRERRTRNEGRVRRLIEMRSERRARRERVGRARLSAEESARSGKRVIRTRGLTFSYGQHEIVSDLSTTIWRGDKVGIIGPNGSGKTTLLRLLLGELTPGAGSVEHGTKLEIAYFDQLHAQLDETKTVAHNVADGNDTVERNGRRIHVMGYLRTFLFPPDRAQAPVATLSGGERNRLLLARMFTRPANVIVLDEPTNDLDIETLELLEQLLVDFAGTVLLVSHDRALLENVITQSLVFESGGRVREYAGGYDDWVKTREAAARKPAAAKKPAAAVPPAEAVRRLTWGEKQELAELPDRIEAFEVSIAACHKRMSDPDFFRQDGATIAAARAELHAMEAELAAAYARWESLETRA